MSFGKGGARDNQTNWWWSARSLYGWQLWMGSADWISRKCSLFNEGIPSWRMADQRDSVRFMKFIRNSKRPPTACSTTKRKAEANKRGVSCMYLVVVSAIVIGCHQRYCPTSTASFFASEFRAERGDVLSCYVWWWWCAIDDAITYSSRRRLAALLTSDGVIKSHGLRVFFFHLPPSTHLWRLIKNPPLYLTAPRNAR